MKKRTFSLLLCLVMLFLTVPCTAAEGYEGKITFYDDLLFINGSPILSAQLPNKYVYISVESLDYYGFDVTLDTRPAVADLSGGKYIYTVKRNPEKAVNPNAYMESSAAEALKKQTEVYAAAHSEVYFEGSDTCANIFETENGSVLVQCDELARFGTYTWDDSTGQISINFDESTSELKERSFSEITKITSANEVCNAVIVGIDGKCADISKEDFEKWINTYINFPNFDPVTAPLESFETSFYIKFYGTDDPSTEYTVYSNSGIILGKFGEAAVLRGVAKQNYVWYLPYVGNARNALYSANEALYQKYLKEQGEIFEGPIRDKTNRDAPYVPNENLFSANTASNWAKDEIEKSAAGNLLPKELTDKYRENITREDFCNLIYRLVALEFYPNVDSRMGEWFAAEAILDERQLRDKFNAVSYTDCENDKIKFLSAAGIIYGFDDGCFAPSRALTREQAAAILLRTAEFLRNKTIPESSFIYDDYGEIADWARNAASALYSTGIMKGTAQNTFTPKGGYTVEQAIATIVRLYECN